jgi:hypothetical protein
MKFLIAFVGIMASYSLMLAQTAVDAIPPVATLLGLLALIIKYVRDHGVENDQHDHYERIIEHQRNYFESVVADLRAQLRECHEFTWKRQVGEEKSE